MSASEVMLVAWALLIGGHWAHNEPTLSVNQVVEMVLAILIISFMDQTAAEPVAKGLAWIFLLSVLLGKNSIISSLSSSGGIKTSTATTKAALCQADRNRM